MQAMKCGFIGLGTQGKYLAVNLAQAGHDLMVFDLRREPLAALEAVGAKIARSSKDVGAHGEIVEICVLNDAQLEAVMLAPDGVLAGAARGMIVAIHSTVEPGTIAKLAEAGKAQGVEVIDAPVSGSESGARNKTMSYMVGGSETAFEKCRPLFETSGPKITHTGPLGSGIRAKLAHQLIICVNMLAAYEGMRLGIEAGLTPEILEKVVREGAAQSRIAERWSQMALAPHATGVFYKDLQLCLKYAHELGLSVPGTALAQQLLDRIVP
jgi:3-hydroxyisobutyrate dehydrogenase-like beta-hydroxyacid dehydrogenase